MYFSSLGVKGLKGFTNWERGRSQLGLGQRSVNQHGAMTPLGEVCLTDSADFKKKSHLDLIDDQPPHFFVRTLHITQNEPSMK